MDLGWLLDALRGMPPWRAHVRARPGMTPRRNDDRTTPRQGRALRSRKADKVAQCPTTGNFHLNARAD
jgi:hypothetical protein